MAFNLFKPASRIGIDIGTASIKIIELEKSAGRFNLKNYGLFELKGNASPTPSPMPAMDKGILKLPDGEIIWGIREVISKAKIKARDVVASIPSFSTFSTVIQMPYLTEGDLAKSIPFEARKYIPIPLNEVVLDWSIIDIAKRPEMEKTGMRPTTVEVFIAAVPRDETVRYQRIIQGAGLNLRALELENAALIRGLLGNDLNPAAIVNIGGRSTSILIADRGYERTSHNYEVGGFEITKSIARSLNISLEKADELKKKLGLKESDENIVNEAMTSLIDMMVFETKKTITSYEESRNIKIPKTILVGGLVNMPNFVNYFKRKIEREIFIGNAFARLVYPPELTPVLGEISNTFAVAVGLAMREI